MTFHCNIIYPCSLVLPRGRPRISGGKALYHIGDVVDVNCTSERSKPAATLHWYINDGPVCIAL